MSRLTAGPQSASIDRRVETHRLQGHARLKTRVKPSDETLACTSSPGPLTLGPRFAGSPHSSAVVDRLATQISSSPYPPGRGDEKYSDSASADTSALCAANAPTGGPTFAALPQGSPGRCRVATHRCVSPGRSK